MAVTHNSTSGMTSQASSAASTNEHVFNDDLLINSGDLAFAKSQFPQIFHVLNYPRLREVFARYEETANRARLWVRGLGFAAVLSGTLALLVVATKPVWEHLWPHGWWTRWLALIIESSGVVAAVTAAGGMWFGPWRRRWLESRLMTERLRQWHFQTLLRCGAQIEAASQDAMALTKFEAERDRWFEEFMTAHQGKLDSQLESLVDEPTLGIWMHNVSTSYSHNSAVLEHVFVAYGRLRFEHQYNYAVYKLLTATDKPIWQFLQWPAVCQMQLLSALSSTCFVAALISAVVLIYGHAFGLPEDVELYMRTGAVAAAIIGGALKVLEEGLAPDKEIERYRDYRARAGHLRDRFRQTDDPGARLHLMEELELAAADELKGFLRTHYKARFVVV
jgi:predicted outer membrane protein